MHLKNKITIKLCVALAAVSFLHPFLGNTVYAETNETESCEEEEIAEEAKECEEEETAEEAKECEEEETTEEAKEREEEETAEEAKECEEEETAEEAKEREEEETAEEAKECEEEETAEEAKEQEIWTVLSMERSSIGISETHPQKGQENRYEYTGSEESFTVPATGYYTIICAGGVGGTGDYHGGRGSDCKGKDYAEAAAFGNKYKAQFKLFEGEILKIHVGGAGGNAANSETRGSGGYSDGGTGGKDRYTCDDGSNHSGRAAGGGGGGSSYAAIGEKLISAGGGNGGAAGAKSCGGQVRAGGGGGGGSSFAHSISSAAELVSGTALHDGGNNGNGYIVIRVEKIGPEVLLDADTDWSNQEIKITAEAINEGEGLSEKYLSWEKDEEGKDIWTDIREYTVSRNGTYTCKIRDTAGNIEESVIEISNIDRLQPEGNLSADITDWTKGDVSLTITARDAEATAEDGKSGLAEKAYLWGQKTGSGEVIYEMAERMDAETGETKQEEAWADTAVYTVSQNGMYLCRIKDNAGNETLCEYIVTNIDRTAPEITYERLEKWYEGSTNILWHGEDIQPDGSSGCGLHELAYSFDGTNFDGQNCQLVEEENSYYVWVRDRLGNVSMAEATMQYDQKEEREEKNEKEETAEAAEKKGEEKQEIPFMEESRQEEFLLHETEQETDEEPLIIANAIRRPEKKEAETVLQISKTMFCQEEAEKEKKKENKQLKIIEKEMENPHQKEEKEQIPRQRWNWKKTVLYTVWTAVIFCGLIWLLFCLLFEHVTVYRRKKNGSYYKIGRCAIIRKKEYLQINLLHLMKNTEGYDYMLRFSGIFVCLHKKRKVLIRTNAGVELRRMAGKMEILWS